MPANNVRTTTAVTISPDPAGRKIDQWNDAARLDESGGRVRPARGADQWGRAQMSRDGPHRQCSHVQRNEALVMPMLQFPQCRAQRLTQDRLGEIELFRCVGVSLQFGINGLAEVRGQLR